LEDGVQKGFVPASYWLARLRYGRARSRKIARQIAPLLEYAADKGHPGAELMLGRLLLSGKLGLRGIPRGLGMFRAFVVRAVKAGDARKTAGASAFLDVSFSECGRRSLGE
jgi:TPR repeat protein